MLDMIPIITISSPLTQPVILASGRERHGCSIPVDTPLGYPWGRAESYLVSYALSVSIFSIFTLVLLCSQYPIFKNFYCYTTNRTQIYESQIIYLIFHIWLQHFSSFSDSYRCYMTVWVGCVCNVIRGKCTLVCYLKPLTAADPNEMLLTHKAWSLQGMSLTKKACFRSYLQLG